MVRVIAFFNDSQSSTRPVGSCEWLEWSWFISRNRPLFSDDAVAAWKERAYTFCVDEVVVIKHNADSAFHAESWLAEIKETAEAWGFSLKAEEEEIQRWMAEKEPRSGGDEEWEGGGRGSPDPNLGGTDRDIDRLFGSLANRDP